MTVDGVAIASNPATIAISDDGKIHTVHIVMGEPAKKVA
jgi:alpha-D-ribose 1-methylphosphonate 5-triphosphate diphosphatase PhnM